LLQGFWDSTSEAEGGADFRHDLNTTTPEPEPETTTEIRCSFASGGSFDDTSFFLWLFSILVR
jgi:hypothetical protein